MNVIPKCLSKKLVFLSLRIFSTHSPVTILMTVCNVIRRKDAKPKVENVVPLGQKLLLLRALNSISAAALSLSLPISVTAKASIFR